jgi:hypothetical protein
MFGLIYFQAYIKQFIQINNLLYIIYKFVKAFYEIIAYENTIFTSESLYMN